ncbi:MAG: RraA family protein [Planctomycetota bacterium]
MARHLTHGEMLQLKRWNTPTMANGWEQITSMPFHSPVFNRDPVTDFMPHMGPMVGRAITLVIQPSNRGHVEANPKAWSEYRRYLASVAGPKIAVVQDLDAPNPVGSCWGEVNSNIHRALGCVGTIVDGCIRDLDEMHNAGFKALARRLCVSHIYATPVSWGEAVEVFGVRVEPGQLIHADKHGFFAVPADDEEALLEAARFMDTNECSTVIAAARNASGKSPDEILRAIDDAAAEFDSNTRRRFGRSGEF